MLFEKLHGWLERQSLPESTVPRRRMLGLLFAGSVALSGAATLQEIRPHKPNRADYDTPLALKGESYVRAPDVVLARREDLPKVFLKPVPSSIADLKDFEARTESLVKRVSAAVVAVELRGGTGSGVVVTKDGLILTAAHVCGEPFLDVVIRFPDGTKAKGKTLGTDHDMDAGLVQITDKGPWPHAEMGDLTKAQAGDWVIGLGHPGGFEKNRTVVARLGRIVMLREEVVQTDCTLIGGDSGGPLFDMFGRVIGIHSRISNATSENYHVPIDAFADSWIRLARGECWGEEEPHTSAWVGARCADRTEGCRIERVEELSPASRAKLKVGDIVESINDTEVKDYASFLQRIEKGKRGEDLVFKIKREGANRDVTIKYPTGPTRLNR